MNTNASDNHPFAQTPHAAGRRKLLFATRNQGKVAELAFLCRDLPVEIISAAQIPDFPDIAETGQTFFQNAALKALGAARHTGLCALADDSGLQIDALGGQPGIHSARFGGLDTNDRKNMMLVLEKMASVAWPKRTARFRCVVVFVDPTVLPPALTDPISAKEIPPHASGLLTATGTCEGYILEAPKGTSGFGYDPVFYYPRWAKTFAELEANQKNRVSHRARALSRLKSGLIDYFAKRL
jgi:XTP/dITP diphosphohydrolase